MNKTLFGKAMKNVRKHRPNNCNNKKKLFGIGTKLSYNNFFWKYVNNRNNKNTDTFGYSILIGFINIRIKENSDIGVLGWLHKTKLWRKSKPVLCEYQQEDRW